MSTRVKNLDGLSIAELGRLAHAVHVGRGEAGHSEEVHFATCEHKDCVAIRRALDARD